MTTPTLRTRPLLSSLLLASLSTLAAGASAQPAPTPEPDRLAVGEEGTFRPGALLQGWFFFLREGGDVDETTTTFRVRRAELKISGDIVPDTFEYKVMIDPAKVLEPNEETIEVRGQEPAPATPGTVEVEQPGAKSSVLQDFVLTYVTDYVEASIGQFKNPMSWEGYNSSSKLILPDRALVSSRLGDDRDLGVKLEKRLGRFRYWVGLYNGEGLNRRDSNDQKDLTLRVEVYPIDGMMLGGVAYASVGERDLPGSKEAFEGDARLDLADVLVQGEYIHRSQRADDLSVVDTHGFYGALGVTFLDLLQPVVRVGLYDPDLGAGGDEIWQYDAGLNVLFRGHELKLQSSYTYFDAETPTQQVIFSTQAMF